MPRFARTIAQAAAFAAAALLAVQPAAAQSILRDAETEALFRDMSEPLIKAAGLDPRNVDIVLVGDNSINAFVAGGQAVYLNSGLIGEATSANQVQGVIAHELGHVTGGHVIAGGEAAKSATGITLLSMLLGVAAAVAGAGDAAMGVMAAGQQAAMGKYLAFSRTQESAADAAGAAYLSGAGISGQGSLEFFKKLQQQEYRYGYSQSDENDFFRTHPSSSDRIARLTETYSVDPAWKKPSDPELERRFQLVKAKLYGYLAEPRLTLQAYPEYLTTEPARYARAYAFHKDALMDKALAEADALLANDPDNPYFLEIKGQILLESGRAKDALAPLRRATELTRNQPLIATTFGHALIATEDKANYAEAERVLRSAVSRDRENPFAWYQLGVVYEAQGDTARAQLATAEQQALNREMPRALSSAQMAMVGLPRGTPDWLRAQDIAFQARAAIEGGKKRR